MEQSVQLTVGMENEVRKRLDSGTVLAWKTRQIYVGQIWCCEVFSLAGNVVLLLICTFLKHNNKISLSHWVSPHWGFPWHLPKFFSVIGLLSTVFFCCIFFLSNVYFCLWKFLNVGLDISKFIEDNYL